MWDYIAENAPFLAAYWWLIVVLGTTVVMAVLLAYFFFPAAAANRNRRQQQPPQAQGQQGVKRDGGTGPSDSAASSSKDDETTISSSRLRDDHPLVEFEDSKPDPSLAPPLHSPELPHVPYDFVRLSEAEMKRRSREFYHRMDKRRSIRNFSSELVPLEVIENIVKMAGTAPSGAHSEPWTFVVVESPKVKRQVREIVEREEYLNYDRRMGDTWVNNLKFVRTTHEKPYLEEAPFIIFVFKQSHHVGSDGTRHAHYYYEISTAIAAGFLLAAVHNAGLVAVTTTPLNAGVELRELLGRPDNEKVMLLLPVGYPAPDAKVPDVRRKPLKEIMVLK